MAEMLKIDHICKTFNAGTINEKVALNGVDLTLEDGDFVTVIGGKTGTTEAAGSCLVLYSESQDKKPYISIVLKGNSKKELYTLMTELLTNYSN